jgi:7-cyano-7-deazaguanine synthase
MNPKLASNQESEVLVLLSGGIDSAACVAFFQNRGNQVTGMFVDYGQISATRERKAAGDISRYFGIKLNEVRCTGVSRKADGCIRARNALLACIGLMEAGFRSGAISLGIHSGTDYWDCTKEFVALLQRLFDGYADGCVRLLLPFVSWNKRQIWDYCQAGKVPIELTYSCERGLDQPCHLCSSCRDLEVLRALPIHAHST